MKKVVLKKMLSMVLKDKEKIEETIEELDRHKRDACRRRGRRSMGKIYLSV